MEPIPADSERSVVRSRIRYRALIMLSSVGEAYASQLARMLGTSPARLRAALHGSHPDYREDLSLVGLGLVDVKLTPAGRVYEITTRGRRKARSLVSRQASGRR